MPKELKAFQAEHANLVKQADVIYEEDKRVDSADSHLGAMRKQAIDAIAVRVQELKDKGAKGAKIDDFLSDAETKKYYAEGLAFVQKTKENHARGAKNCEAAKKLVDVFKKLEADLRKEAAARKKKLIGKESQSAPEMEKLANQIPPFLRKPPGNMAAHLEGLAKGKGIFKADKSFAAAVDKAIKGTADNVKAQQADNMLKQSLNLRLLTSKVSKFKADRTKSQAALQAALKAVAAKNSAEAKKQFGVSLNIVEAMDKELKPLNVAYKEFEEWIKQDKMGTKVLEQLNLLTSIHNAALKETAAVQAKVK